MVSLPFILINQIFIYIYFSPPAYGSGDGIVSCHGVTITYPVLNIFSNLTSYVCLCHDKIMFFFSIIRPLIFCSNYYSIIFNALLSCLLNPVRNGHPYTGFNCGYGGAFVIVVCQFYALIFVFTPFSCFSFLKLITNSIDSNGCVTPCISLTCTLIKCVFVYYFLSYSSFKGLI